MTWKRVSKSKFLFDSINYQHIYFQTFLFSLKKPTEEIMDQWKVKTNNKISEFEEKKLKEKTWNQSTTTRRRTTGPSQVVSMELLDMKVENDGVAVAEFYFSISVKSDADTLAISNKLWGPSRSKPAPWSLWLPAHWSTWLIILFSQFKNK